MSDHSVGLVLKGLTGIIHPFHANVQFLNPLKTYSGVKKWQAQPPEVFCKKGVLKNFSNFTGKHLCWGIFLIKLHEWKPVTLKKETLTQVVPVKFTKFLRAPIQFLISKNICERLLLKRNICVKWVNVEEKMRKMKLRNEKLVILNLIYNRKFRVFQTVRETRIRTFYNFNSFQISSPDFLNLSLSSE